MLKSILFVFLLIHCSIFAPAQINAYLTPSAIRNSKNIIFTLVLTFILAYIPGFALAVYALYTLFLSDAIKSSYVKEGNNAIKDYENVVKDVLPIYKDLTNGFAAGIITLFIVTIFNDVISLNLGAYLTVIASSFGSRARQLLVSVKVK